MKRILLILIIVIGLCGCTNLKDLSYDDIINTLNSNPKVANTFKKGYKFYVPSGLSIKDAGTNYVILNNNNCNYYLYFDLISYNSKTENNYEIDKNAYYSQKFFKQNKSGYVEVNLSKNNKYLIEIMYNYAKIEVMVDEGLIKKALINSINILNSIKYDDLIIENLLNDDNLDYTEEIFDIFESREKNSNILDYVEDNEVYNTDNNDEIVDTDYLN